MTQIWIVRHGEAAASWEKDPDPGLSGLGQSQAEETATALLDIVPMGTQLISSPLRRAQETAAAFANKRGDSVRVDPRFSEVRSPVPLSGRKALRPLSGTGERTSENLGSTRTLSPRLFANAAAVSCARRNGLEINCVPMGTISSNAVAVSSA